MNKDENIQYVESIHGEVSRIREERDPENDIFEMKNDNQKNLKEHVDKLFEDDSKSKINSVQDRHVVMDVKQKHEGGRKEMKEGIDIGITERVNVRDDSSFNHFYNENVNKDRSKENQQIRSGADNNSILRESYAVQPLKNSQNKYEKDMDFFVFDENKGNNKSGNNNELVSADILDNLINNLKDPINEELNYEVNQKQGNNARVSNSNKHPFSSSANIENRQYDKRERIYEGNREFIAESSYGKISIGRDKEDSIKNRKSNVLLDNLFTKIKDSTLDIQNNKKMAPYLIINTRELEREIESIFLETLTKIDIDVIKSKYSGYIINEVKSVGPIGPLCDLNKMANVSGISKFKKQLTQISEDIGLWRMILGDGNCFYRGFMFAYLEASILNKNIDSIKKFVYDFNSKMDVKFKRKNVVINKHDVIAIFIIIIELMEKSDLKGAYEILIKSYHLFENFDLGLVKYMRCALAKFIDDNKHAIYNAETNVAISSLLPSAYINESSRINNKIAFDFVGFYDEFLLSMQNEAEKIIIYISPIAFNVNLDLYVLEGVANTEEDARYFKYNFPSNSPFDPTISLFYRFSHYDKFYSKDTIELFKEILSNLENKVENIVVENRLNSLGIIPCDRCNQETELIQFTLLQFADCRLCITKFINDIIFKRVKNYINEGYINLEYYCRPVNLGENKILYDEDFMHLYSKTISQIFKSTLESTCSFCSKIYENENNFVKLKCECKLCKSCLIRKLKTVTDGKIFFNSYEKKHLKPQQDKCFCLDDFDLDSAISLIRPELEEYRKKSEERLAVMACKYCLVCDKSAIANPEQPKQKNLIVQVLDQGYNFNHVICVRCHDKNKSLKLDSLKCQLCDVNHKIDRSIWDTVVAGQNACGCCLIF